MPGSTRTVLGFRNTTISPIRFISRFGVRGRLYLSFLAVASIVALSSAFAIHTSSGISAAIDEVVDGRLPPLVTALTLSRDSEALTGSLPILVASKTDSERKTTYGLIQTSLQKLAEKLNVLERQGVRSQDLKNITQTIDALKANAETLDQAVIEKNKNRFAIGAVRTKIQETNSNLQAVISQIAKMGVDTETLSAINSAASNMLTLLVEVRNEGDPSMLQLWPMRYTGEMVGFEGALTALGENGDSLANLAETLKSFSTASELRLRELEIDNRIRGVLKKAKQQSIALSSEVDLLVGAARNDIAQARSIVKRSQSNMVVVLSAITGAGLVLSALIGWLYVGRNVIARLNSLRSAMTELASGNLDVAIPSKGSDEIASMADTLLVFRENALHERELERQAEEERTQNLADREAQERLIENAVGEIVTAAVNGDLTKRIDTGSLNGAIANIGNDINGLVETVDQVITELNGVLAALANGNLTARLNKDYKGAFFELKMGANKMAAQMANTVKNVIDTAETVRAATAKIATGSSDLSARSESQAASLEEVAAAMEELTGAVRQNALNSQKATEVTDESHQAAVEGGKAVGQTIAAMSGIEESSQEISAIVGMIDEIAFQTNLLALNAAVEAARAGEAGKGFTVVAQEVRSLAQRSGEASKEIKKLIDNSAEKVTSGVRLAKRAGAVFEEILASISNVNDIVSEIVSASGEQATGIDEVNLSVTQIDEMTQQNAALVERTRTSVETLDDQAKGLSSMLEFFRLEPCGAEPPPGKAL